MFLPRTVIEVERIPVILYVEPDFLVDCPRQKQTLQEYTHSKLHQLPDFALLSAHHAIAFIWGLAEAPAVTHVDLWVHGKETETKDGFLITRIATFANGEETTKQGVASGTTCMVAGLEEIYRRAVMAEGGSFQDYLFSEGPLLPPDMQLDWEA